MRLNIEDIWLHAAPLFHLVGRAVGVLIAS
jgi:hypothetical protein